jgi:hypothetical protein
VKIFFNGVGMMKYCVFLPDVLIDILTPSRSSWDPDNQAMGQGSSKWDIPSPAPSRDSGIGTKKLVSTCEGCGLGCILQMNEYGSAVSLGHDEMTACSYNRRSLLA